MDNETVNKLVAQISAVERVVTMLLADALKRLSGDDLHTLEAVLENAEVPPPQAPNISVADDWAGRAQEYERVVARILTGAREIAALPGDQKGRGW